MRSWRAWTGLVGLLLASANIDSADAARARHLRQANIDDVLLPPPAIPHFDDENEAKDLRERTFTLRHIYHHGSHRFPKLHRYLDVSPEHYFEVTADYGASSDPAPPALPVRVSTLNIQRLAQRQPSDVDALLAYAEVHGQAQSLPSSAWTVDEVSAPNITDKTTILSFARMAANAYVQKHGSSDWQPVKGGFNYTDDFGWQEDGLRGHIFADETNQTVVIGLKGTSPAVWDGADTTGNDKLNDNLFGSCCCGQGGPITWRQVCDCMTTTYTCNNTCLVKSLRQKSHYYWAVRDLYHNVTERYPNAEVWLAGHSLGGVVSSMLGLTYGLPSLTFEAFPDALAASRLGLPTPPGYRIGSHHSRTGTGVYHFGHSADPIFMGQCNGGTSFCSIAGYAFQGVCHTGKTCLYDTVGDLGWRVSIGTHKILNVIRDVLEKYDTVPKCEEDVECQDCYLWNFFESNGTEPITSTTSISSTSTTTRTRTATCQTPGWWGCLDESTSSTSVTTALTSTATSTSTSTCKTPGWFGCKDETTSPTSVTIPVIATTTILPASSNTACATPGWFGCKDATTSRMSAQPSSTAVPPAVTETQAPSPTSTSLPPASGRCLSRSWLGRCKIREDTIKADL